MDGIRRSSGFTLLEIMIVVAIVGVMALIAIPGITRYQAVESAKSGASTVASALREARSRAMKEGVQYLVFVNPDTSAAGPSGVDYPEQFPAGEFVTVARIVRDNDQDEAESAGTTRSST